MEEIVFRDTPTSLARASWERPFSFLMSGKWFLSVKEVFISELENSTKLQDVGGEGQQCQNGPDDSDHQLMLLA